MPKKVDEMRLGRSCGSTVMYYRQLEVNPEFQKNQLDLEMFTAQARMLGGASARLQTVKIPVSVHIVYNTAEQNISDAQVKSQISVLNQDYRMKNADVSVKCRAFGRIWPPMQESNLFW